MKQLYTTLTAIFILLVIYSCTRTEIIEELGNENFMMQNNDVTIRESTANKLFDKIAFSELPSEKELIENAKQGTGSFLVFVNEAFVADNINVLSAHSYSNKVKVLEKTYSNFLKDLKIPLNNLGYVYDRFKGFEVKLDEIELKRILQSKDIKQVLINHKFKMNFPKIEELNLKAKRQSIISNEQNNVDIIPPGVDMVWSTYPATAAVSNRTAWVMDSGVDLDHDDLNVDVSKSISFVPSEPTAEDGNGHGTHVAGIIGAKYNGSGVVGVAPNAKIAAVKVLSSSGTSYESWILAGIDYIDSEASAKDVINISIESPVPNPSTTLDGAITLLVTARDVIVSICAGNQKGNTSYYPMARINHSNVFVVGATENYDRIFAVNYPSPSVGGSNWGNNIVAAPRVNILSTYIGNGTATMTGTSMAAPHVAGLYMYDNNCHCICEPIPCPFCFGTSQFPQCKLIPVLQSVWNYTYNSSNAPKFKRKQKWYEDI